MDEKTNFGTVFITGLIGDCGDEIGLFLIDVVKQFKAQSDKLKFKVFIKSEGGDILEGLKIKDYLRHMKEEKGVIIMTVGEELVASTATVIHQEGSEGMKFLKPDCKFMIHCPSGGVEGNTKAILEYGEKIKAVDDLMGDIYEESFDLPRAIINEMMEEETWLTAQDCEDLGIAQIYNETPIVSKANV